MRLEYFQLIDRVVEVNIGDRTISSEATVPAAHSIFEGHFPGYPLMPGVLLIESMAQTACALFLSKPEFAGKLAFFMGMDEVKFRKPVIPGDVLELHVEILRAGSKAGKARGEAKVDGQTVTEASFTFALVNRQ